MSDSIKRIPSAQFLMDSGLLFQINKEVLHPLGLALEVVIEDDGSARLGELWDYRDDPEGITYGVESFKLGSDKYAAYMNEFGYAKYDDRVRALGFLTQRYYEPVEEVIPDGEETV